MKALLIPALLILIIGNISAVDTESYRFIDYLRGITAPRKPEIFENGVVFTAPSYFRRVGISFAHEGYARVHWFQHLLLPRDVAEFTVRGRVQRNVEQTMDSGILFHVKPIPENLRYLDYRIIINGLWTTDPLNPLTVSGPSGILESRVILPERPITEVTQVPGSFRFFYRAVPGEIITVAGSFNNWDPFMHQLRETSPGLFTLTLPLPPGTIQYAFFRRGEMVPDPVNPRRLFSRDGRIVSEAVVQ